jgi:hypothetical protein
MQRYLPWLSTLPAIDNRWALLAFLVVVALSLYGRRR